MYVNKTRGDFDTRGKAKLNKLTDSRGLSDEMATCTREKKVERWKFEQRSTHIRRDPMMRVEARSANESTSDMSAAKRISMTS